MEKRRIAVEQLRSQRWFRAPGKPGVAKYYRMNQGGFTTEDHENKPIIGILTTWSDFATCHTLFPERTEQVKRGIWQAGGCPMVLPVMSVSESFVKPSTLMYRNFLAMEVEETIRSQPVDGVVLMGGCDKTTPALIMGAASMNIPAIYLPAGAMLRGNWHGKVLGTGSSGAEALADYRAGKIDERAYREMVAATVRSPGTCNVMGTASTMTAMVDVMGLTLPGASSIPAVDNAHARMAEHCGRRIVDMVWENLRIADLMTPAALQNAVAADMALSGSTNSLIHLVAMARRLGHKLGLDDFAKASERIPVICNLMPSGKYLMEDFFYAGGLTALLKKLQGHLHLNCLTANGRTLGENIREAETWNDDVIRPLNNPVYPAGGLVVLRGSLAPRGAVLKRSAAEPRLLQHTGPAVVFRNYADMLARIDDPDLNVTPNSVLVMQDSGPVGAPGMPEWGMLPIPRKLLKQGVRDMVRISDARMSGTHFGTCVLHVSPESRVGGPLAVVHDGDMIRLDTEARRIDLMLDEDEIETRLRAWHPPLPHYSRGFGWMYSQHVLQADEGCDFEFLARTGETPEPEVR